MADTEPNFFTDPQRRDQPLRVGHVSSLLKSVALAMKEFFAKHIEPRDARLKALEIEIEILKARSEQLKYCGVWKSDAQYYAGNFATYDGSVWHSNIATKGVRPGTSPAWVLAVKHGKDAR